MIYLKSAVICAESQQRFYLKDKLIPRSRFLSCWTNQTYNFPEFKDFCVWPRHSGSFWDFPFSKITSNRSLGESVSQPLDNHCGDRFIDLLSLLSFELWSYSVNIPMDDPQIATNLNSRIWFVFGFFFVSLIQHL